MVATVFTLPDMPRKSLPIAEKKVGLAARVDPRLLDAIADMATADERTLSFMVERAIREFVERHHGKPSDSKRHTAPPPAPPAAKRRGGRQ